MAAGVLVVTARTSILERIWGGRGWLFDAGDADRLAVVLQGVIAKRQGDDGVGRVEMGALEVYSEGRSAERYFAFFQKFLKLKYRNV